jgi:hypothetical protein
MNRGTYKLIGVGNELTDLNLVTDFDQRLTRCTDVLLHRKHYFFGRRHTDDFAVLSVFAVRNTDTASAFDDG